MSSFRDEPSGDVFPTDEEIAERCFQMMIRRESDAITDFWRRAEAELLERAARRVVRRDPPSGRVRR